MLDNMRHKMEREWFGVLMRTGAGDSIGPKGLKQNGSNTDLGGQKSDLNPTFSISFTLPLIYLLLIVVSFRVEKFKISARRRYVLII